VPALDRQLPSGTVTFLFTDIEGSTRLLQMLGPAYQEHLETHRRLVRSAVEAEEGSEVNTEGDAFFVAFSSASRAASAAIAAQRALAAVSWPDVEALFVKAARKFDRDFYLAGKELRLSVLPALRVAGNRQEKLPAVFFVGCRPDQLPHLPAGEEILPVVEFTRGMARDPSPAGRGGFRHRAYLRLPAPFLEADASFLRRTVKEAVRKGHRRWVVSDVGHFALFAGLDLRREVTLISDHYLYGFNMGALSVLSRLGASRMILPVEAPLPALRAVGKYLHGLGIAVAYSSLPLMISRLVPAGGIRGGEVVSPRAERFAIEVDDRGSTLRPVRPFSAAGALHEIRAAGIQDFYVDVRSAPPQEIGSIFAALREDRVIPDTSTFNLFRGNF
jgi:hypothetical protein